MPGQNFQRNLLGVRERMSVARRRRTVRLADASYKVFRRMALVLRRLLLNDEGAFVRSLALTAVSDPRFVHYHRRDLAFNEYLRVLDDAERGRGLPNGHVPSTLLFGFVEREIVGRLMLRHYLNDFLLRIGGHIGYVVVPEHRRRGHATEMLKQGLDLARSMGMERVLVTCDDDNIASRRTIEKCGGEYEDTRAGPESSVGKRRYWIALSKV
jgi:predicted acetyltransferase